jgi:long-chain acyl-CoA synthetase
MNLPAILRATLRHHGQRVAIRDGEGDLSWSAFGLRIHKAAGMMAGMGLRPGDRFALLMRNSFRQAELLWAGYWGGFVPVPVNWRLAPVEVAAILEDCGAGLLIADPDFASIVDAPPLAAWKGKVIVNGLQERWPVYDEALAAASAAPAHDGGENDDALLLYTGGTTGRSKGVRLSHRNIIANAQQIGLGLGLRPSDVWMHVAPMFHAADLLGTICTLLGGAHVYVGQFSAKAALEAIERHRPTATMMAPTMIKMLLDEPSLGQHDLSSLRLLYYGSAPMPVEWIKAAMERFPDAELCQGYGLTETAPILTVLDHETHVKAVRSGDTKVLTSAGKPVIGIETAVVDNADRLLPPGQEGEIVVRGPNVMQGYRNMQEETAKALRGGWFHTGDVGRIDDEGFIYLFDRKKDMVISGGENIYTTEVEAALYRHPGVGEAAVIGVPDPHLGEALFAYIVPKPGVSLTEEIIVQHCRTLIGGYKVPRRMAFVEALPKSAVGKILKTELRKTYANNNTGEKT